MQDEILRLRKKGAVVFTENQIWISTTWKSNMEKFQKSISKEGAFTTSYYIEYSQIQKVKLNEGSSIIKVDYKGKNGNLKTEKLRLRKTETALQFGNFLGNQLNLAKSIVPEKPVKPILLGLYLVFALSYIVFNIGRLPDNLEPKRGKDFTDTFTYWIIEMIGKEGFMILIGLLIIYVIWLKWKRYKNPLNDIIYQRRSTIIV